MAASMGYANVFKQAGLIDDLKASKFSAMSFNSGSAWFATQFFYSQNFFELVVGSTDNVSNLVYDWMQSYIAFQESVPVSPLCTDPNGIIQLFQFPLKPSDLIEICNVYVSVGGSWAVFIEIMLNGASKSYGDPLLPNRTMSKQLANRVIPMSNTDLYIQTTLAPNSRSGIGLSSPGDNAYLADTPQNGAPVTEVYAVPLAAQFSFTPSGYNFYVGLEEGNDGLSTVYEPALSHFYVSNYSEFGLYPGTGDSVYVKAPAGTVGTVSPFREPFGGHPTVTQIAAASSATLGQTSGSVPSVLAQYFSVKSFFIANSGLPPSAQAPLLAQVATAASTLYTVPISEDSAVCSQWPADCGTSDGRLMDGAFSDGISLALNIGQYQTVDGGSLDKTIKVIMSNNNVYKENQTSVLVYFNTTFNAKVAPGDFLWGPATDSSTSTGSQVQGTPWRSAQIFEEYLDDTILSSCLLNLPNSQMTYCFLNATTIDNAYFGVKAGQKVEILLFEINSEIPTFLIGRNATTTYVEPLVNLARDIASNTDLVSIVASFVKSNH